MTACDPHRVGAIGLDLDQPLYRREPTFARFFDEACMSSSPNAVDRAEVARLDDRGYGDKRALLAHLAPRLGWNAPRHEARYERFAEENLLAMMQPDTELLGMRRRAGRRRHL